MKKTTGTISALIAAVALCATCLLAGCDASAMTSAATPAPTTTASATPAATSTARSTPTASASPTASPTATPATPSPTATHTPSPTPSPTELPSGPAALEPASEEILVDATGDGALNTVTFDPANVDASGYLMLTIDGVDYATYVPQGGEFTFFPVDILPGDSHTEFLIMRKDGSTSELYLCRLNGGVMEQGTFTYMLPAELSPSGIDEARYMEPRMIFSGVEPIVNLQDGSFAVLALGQGFQRYVMDSAFTVTEAELLPLTLLTNGSAQILASATPAPLEASSTPEVADPSVEDPAYYEGIYPADPNVDPYADPYSYGAPIA